MYLYFNTELQNRSINGEEIECEVVNSITHSSTKIIGAKEIPNGYDESIMGQGYFPNDEHQFKVLDALPSQPTQEDTIKELQQQVSELQAQLEDTELNLIECLVGMFESIEE